MSWELLKEWHTIRYVKHSTYHIVVIKKNNFLIPVVLKTEKFDLGTKTQWKGKPVKQSIHPAQATLNKQVFPGTLYTFKCLISSHRC